ncbi:MAG: molybdenum cofactor guanylyltransferase [Ilumatobacter sp.]|uniref:molybdenum cofactor guanylyltransferase n=1 Tax=Ilumatobacter sp. TaxID=1967498 RepID=UPI00391BD59B
MPSGVMLAGGASSRMGRTKALIEIDGEPMGNRVLRALRTAGCAPVIVYGGDPDELAGLDADVVPDRHPGSGPLGGIVGVFETLDVTTVLVVACDAPDLDQTVLGPLLAAAEAALAGVGDGESPDVVVADTGRLEPMCAVWHASARDELVRCFEGGERAVHRALRGLRVLPVSVPARGLRNLNTPGDVAARKRRPTP